MKKVILTIAICIVALCGINAQNTTSKPALNHGVYDNWKSISNIKIDDKTQSLFFTIRPQEGDNIFVVYNIKKAKEQRFDRLTKTMLSSNGEILVGLIKPTFQQIRQAKINKEKKRSNAEAPKDTLAIINLKTGDIKKFPNLKTLSTPDVLNDYIAFMLTPDKKADEKKKGDDTLKQVSDTLKKNKTAQKDIQDNLYVMNVLSGKIDTIKQVEKFTTLRNGTISYITKLPKQDKKKALKTGSDTTQIEQKALTKTDKREDLDTMKFSLYLYEPATKSRRELISGRKGAKINLPIRNTKTGYYAFLAQLDTAEKANNFALYLYKGEGGVVKVETESSLEHLQNQQKKIAQTMTLKELSWIYGRGMQITTSQIILYKLRFQTDINL